MATSSGQAYITPATPQTKKVQFRSPDIESYSRPLSSTEAWSLWHFETHAHQCPECYNPLKIHQEGRRLCDTGHALAQDVAEHVYHHAGEIYSKTTDDHKLVRVELLPNYGQTRCLLQAIDRALRSTSRTTPVITYDPTYPVTRRRSPSPERRSRYRDENQKEAVYIERNVSERKPPRTVVFEAASCEKKPDARRGSLYNTDIQRLKKDKGYVVEIREPGSWDRKRRRQRGRDTWRTGSFRSDYERGPYIRQDQSS